MPSALYAISYGQTGSVLALCSFEQQDLPDKAAWTRLLAALVGAGLPISLSTSGASIEIAASELGCDLVTAPSRQDLEAALAEPYRFRVGVDPEGPVPVVPPLGDGKAKVLRRATRNSVRAIELTATSPASGPAQVRVTLTTAPSDTVKAFLVFEGRPPLVRDPPPPVRDPAAARTLVFSLPGDANVASGASYGMVLIMEGAPIEARSVRAVARTETDTSVAAPVVAPGSAPAPAPGAPAVSSSSPPRAGS